MDFTSHFVTINFDSWKNLFQVSIGRTWWKKVTGKINTNVDLNKFKKVITSVCIIVNKRVQLYLTLHHWLSCGYAVIPVNYLYLAMATYLRDLLKINMYCKTLMCNFFFICIPINILSKCNTFSVNFYISRFKNTQLCVYM